MNPTNLTRILHAFRSRPVLIVGDVMLDRYVWGHVTRVSPEAPVPIVAKQRTSSSPGGAGNVAATVAGLGGQPLLVGLAGDSSEGRELHETLARCGVDPRDVVLAPNRRTTVKTRIIAHNQQLLRIDEEDTAPASAGTLDELLAHIDSRLPSAASVILSDYAKGLLTPALLREVISRARRAGVPVLVDPKGSDFTRYNGASLLTPNRSEAFHSAGLRAEHGATVAEAGGHLLAHLDVDALLITEGEAGMTLFERGGSTVHLPASARVVFDVTGAGDAVIATLGLALAAGGSLQEATQLANLAGGLAVEQVGTATLTASALEEALLGNPRADLP